MITLEDEKYLDKAIAKAKADVGEMREAMAEAHSAAGDGWHDNEHITLVGREKGFVSRQSAYEELARSCVVVTIEEQNYEVGLGNVVLLKDDEGEHYAMLVGVAVGERGIPLISSRSPLGQQLLGKHFGDTVVSPGGKTVTVLDIMTRTEYEAVVQSNGS